MRLFLLIVLTLFVRAFAGTPSEPTSALAASDVSASDLSASDPADSSAADLDGSAPDALDDDDDEELAALAQPAAPLHAPAARSTVARPRRAPPKGAFPPLFRPPRSLQA